MLGTAYQAIPSIFRGPVAAKRFGLELADLERAERAEDSSLPRVFSGGRIS